LFFFLFQRYPPPPPPPNKIRINLLTRIQGSDKARNREQDLRMLYEQQIERLQQENMELKQKLRYCTCSGNGDVANTGRFRTYS
jgi:hypothetical protein